MENSPCNGVGSLKVCGQMSSSTVDLNWGTPTTLERMQKCQEDLKNTLEEKINSVEEKVGVVEEKMEKNGGENRKD
ncbi:hypothetical protein TNCV_5013561 [Trichonephila clavipes]|nr:hypothetical protein TNCV_5013561 [Trichonephila clavipes]